MRSLLYVPAHSERFVAKAHERDADAIILDLEDSVPADRKDAARLMLVDSVASVRQGGARVFVRINTPDNDQVADAVAACRAGADGLIVPKVQSAQDIDALVTILEHVERDGPCSPMGLIALIEDAGGLLDSRAIAGAPRLIGLALGGEDFALSIGAEPMPEVLRLPKLMVHYAAKARGLMSLGLLRSIADYSDHDGIEAAAREASIHGFDGATCVHPSVVPLLNVGFVPSAEQRAWAKRVVEAAETGEGAFVIEGKMVDAPVIARARLILARSTG